MKEIDKPNFVGEGFWVDDGLISGDILTKLNSIASRTIDTTSEDWVRFIVACSNWVQLSLEGGILQSGATIRKELSSLVALVEDVRKHLSIMGKDSVEAFNMGFDSLAFLSRPEVFLSDESISRKFDFSGGKILEVIWDLLEDIILVSEYSSKKLTPTQEFRVQDHNSNAIICRIADSYFHIFGKYPPHSKGTWFPEFMECLGQWSVVRLPCGQKRVEAVLKKLKAQQRG